MKRLDFQQVGGDFKIYQGYWLLDDYSQGHGTFLSYKSEVKPDFFASSFVVRYVQKHDFPMVLSAMKNRAESTAIPVSEMK